MIQALFDWAQGRNGPGKRAADSASEKLEKLTSCRNGAGCSCFAIPAAGRHPCAWELSKIISPPVTRAPVQGTTNNQGGRGGTCVCAFSSHVSTEKESFKVTREGGGSAEACYAVLCFGLPTFGQQHKYK